MFGQSYINSYQPNINSFNDSYNRVNTAGSNYHFSNNSDIFRNNGNYVIPTQTNNYQYSGRSNNFFSSPSNYARSGTANSDFQRSKYNNSSFVVNEAQYQYKPEESKRLLDKRYSSFRNNLNPKIGSRNKNTLISEYDSEYVPYSPEFYVPIYSKNKGLKRLENHDSIFRKETTRKKNYDNIGNYKLPYKLKQQLEALETMEEYNYFSSADTEISKTEEPVVTKKVEPIALKKVQKPKKPEIIKTDQKPEIEPEPEIIEPEIKKPEIKPKPKKKEPEIKKEYEPNIQEEENPEIAEIEKPFIHKKLLKKDENKKVEKPENNLKNEKLENEIKPVLNKEDMRSSELKKEIREDEFYQEPEEIQNKPSEEPKKVFEPIISKEDMNPMPEKETSKKNYNDTNNNGGVEFPKKTEKKEEPFKNEPIENPIKNVEFEEPLSLLNKVPEQIQIDISEPKKIDDDNKVVLKKVNKVDKVLKPNVQKEDPISNTEFPFKTGKNEFFEIEVPKPIEKKEDPIKNDEKENVQKIVELDNPNVNTNKVDSIPIEIKPNKKIILKIDDPIDYDDVSDGLNQHKVNSDQNKKMKRRNPYPEKKDENEEEEPVENESDGHKGNIDDESFRGTIIGYDDIKPDEIYKGIIPGINPDEEEPVEKKVDDDIGFMADANVEPQGQEANPVITNNKKKKVDDDIGFMDDLNVQPQGKEANPVESKKKKKKADDDIGFMDNLNVQPQGKEANPVVSKKKKKKVDDDIGYMDDLNVDPQQPDAEPVMNTNKQIDFVDKSENSEKHGISTTYKKKSKPDSDNADIPIDERSENISGNIEGIQDENYEGQIVGKHDSKDDEINPDFYMSGIIEGYKEKDIDYKSGENIGDDNNEPGIIEPKTKPKKVDDDIGYMEGEFEGDDDGEAGIIRKKTKKRKVDDDIGYREGEFEGDDDREPGIIERESKKSKDSTISYMEPTYKGDNTTPPGIVEREKEESQDKSNDFHMEGIIDGITPEGEGESGEIQGIKETSESGIINGQKLKESKRVYVGDSQKYEEDWLSQIFVDYSENSMNHDINLNA